MPEITEANADELIKVCCGLHIQAIKREGLNEDGELWKLWKRLSNALTKMGLLEAEEEPKEEAEEEWTDEGDDTDWDDFRVIGGVDFGNALDALKSLSIIKN